MKKIIRFLLWIGILLYAASAAAYTADGSIITLPTDGSNVIKEGAYKGSGDLDVVILSSGVESIGSGAFEDSTLNIIRIPDSTTVFGTDWGSNAGDALLINCSKGSVAYREARSRNFDFDCGGKRLAIVIGETYDDNDHLKTLYGPANDLQTMTKALQIWGYSVTPLKNPTKKEILSAVSSVFGEADQYDTCILYYSGHGQEGGNLPASDYDGINGGILTADELGNAMREIKGRKVVIADCCYSGALTEKSSAAKGLLSGTADGSGEEAAFLDDFMSGFSARPMLFGAKSILSNTEDTYVIAACQSDQKSYEMIISVQNPDTGIKCSKDVGVFSYYVGNAIGWNGVADIQVKAAADGYITGNIDKAISIEELYEYARNNTYNKMLTKKRTQYAAVSPSGATYFAPFRRRINMLSVTADETEVTVNAGETATFSVTASGTGPFHYQWKVDRNDGKGWVSIGDDSPVYTTSSVSPENDGYRYICTVTDATGLSATSETMTLRVRKRSDGMPETGDETPLLLWALLAAGSAVIIGFLIRKRRR